MSNEEQSLQHGISGRFRWIPAVIVIAIAVIGLLLWQQVGGGATPALAGPGDATGPVELYTLPLDYTGGPIYDATSRSVKPYAIPTIGKYLQVETGLIDDPIDGAQNAVYVYTWYSGGVVVDGETSNTYDVLARDIGNSIYIVVTFLDDSGKQERLQSAAVGPVPAPDEENNPATGEIVLSYIIYDEQTIGVHDDLLGVESILVDDDGVPDYATFRWQWLRDDRPIPGATNRDSYIVTADDIGTRLSLRLRFQDRLGYEEELFSEKTTIIPNGPVIVATNGFYWDENNETVETLRVDVSKMGYPGLPAPSNRSYEYRWEYVEGVNGNPASRTAIPRVDRSPDGAKHDTSETYTLTKANNGKHITVAVTIRDKSNNSVWGVKFANSATPLISYRQTPGRDPHKARGPVTLDDGDSDDDIPQVGETLTVDTSLVTDPDGVEDVSYTYTWHSGGTVVEDETSETYRVMARDMGNRIYVVVTFLDDAGNEERLQSAAVGPVPVVADHEVSGGIFVYQINDDYEIEVHTDIGGEASGAYDEFGLPDPADFRWQWLRDDRPIPGATNNESYIVTADDIGARLSLRLQFTDLLGFEEEFFSGKSNIIPNGPAIVARYGAYWDDDNATVDTLTVDVHGLNYPNMPRNRSYEYVWVYHLGGEPDDFSLTRIDLIEHIPVGDRADGFDTGETFTLTEADNGKRIFFVVTIRNADDNEIWDKKYANMATPAITKRRPVEAAMNLVARVPSDGGSVTLTWGQRSDGMDAPTRFEYRYKPTAVLDNAPFTDSDWGTAPGGARARSFTMEGGSLIHSAAYTFEVRSYGNGGYGSAPERDEETYRHKMRDCTSA